MAVYAPIPPYADAGRHPRAFVLIIAAHAAALAAVMSAKMDLPAPWSPTVTKVTLVPEQKPPPENLPPETRQEQRSPASPAPPRVVPMPSPDIPYLDPAPVPLPDIGQAIGPGTDPRAGLAPTPALERSGPRFVTPQSRVKPPYPQQKLRMGEEAVLRLRLAIDERGRVTSVEPVGAADPVFLAAARRHLIAHWRYRPATEGPNAIASSTVITLRFQLDE